MSWMEKLDTLMSTFTQDTSRNFKTIATGHNLETLIPKYARDIKDQGRSRPPRHRSRRDSRPSLQSQRRRPTTRLPHRHLRPETVLEQTTDYVERHHPRATSGSGTGPRDTSLRGPRSTMTLNWKLESSSDAIYAPFAGPRDTSSQRPGSTTTSNWNRQPLPRER